MNNEFLEPTLVIQAESKWLPANSFFLNDMGRPIIPLLEGQWSWDTKWSPAPAAKVGNFFWAANFQVSWSKGANCS
jgi:hypothetical protein